MGRGAGFPGSETRHLKEVRDPTEILDGTTMYGSSSESSSLSLIEHRNARELNAFKTPKGDLKSLFG